MIHYHGTPMTPTEAAIRLLRGRHAFISYLAQDSLPIAQEFCQSFAVDNGAFSVWKRGATPDWPSYYKWVEDVARYPNFDFAVIPDCIDGEESDNDALLKKWPHGNIGAPVWHLHESLDRLHRLAIEWPRICLGSSGAYQTPNTEQWWLRINQVMEKITCDGFPITKIHGLRMLNPEIFARIPMASADSTNVCQNAGVAWRGHYEPATKATKAIVIAERIELAPVARRWAGSKQQRLFGSAAG